MDTGDTNNESRAPGAVDAELRKEVFAWYGGAAYAAQCFEVELVTLLLTVHRVRCPDATREQLEQIDLQLSRRTLGQLLAELKSRFDIHPEFESLLYQYLQKRNYLAHRFFYENATKLLSRDGCEAMIAELKELEATMREADNIAQSMSTSGRAILGISERDLQAFVQDELARHVAGVPNDSE